MFRNAFVLAIAMATYAFAQTTITDPRDGKKYKTVKIGTQTWMAQDLDYGGEDGDIGSCPDNDPNNCSKYGRLYDWENAMFSCPDGWHLPDDAAWQTLTSFAGGSATAGRKLRARSGWEKWNCEWAATDDRGRAVKVNKCNSDNYGFSASPSSSNGQYGYWWTSSETYYGVAVAWTQHNSEEMRFGNDNKSKRYNVRCLKGQAKLPANLVAKKTAAVAAEAEKKAEKKAEAENPLTTEVTTEGTILRGSTLAKKLAWLNRSAESHNTYIIEVNANENIAPHKFEYENAINITIILRGDDENRAFRLSTHGTMFTVRSNVTLILDGNITLMGHSGNTGAMIYVDGGILTMNAGTTITDNNNVGVTIGENYGNKGTFTMNGGAISNNTSYGVWVRKGAFTMNEGSISNNKGNGVVVEESSSFTMRDGIISNNKGRNGGGVHNRGTFTMRGGTITDNSASEYGGGVYLGYSTFTKTGGTITGYNSNQSDGNVVKDEEGVLARRGHAISFRESQQRKETTTGSEDNLSCTSNKCTGAWDQ